VCQTLSRPFYLLNAALSLHIVQAVVVASLAIVSFVAIPKLLEDLVHTPLLPFAINSDLSACAAALWEFSTALLFFCAIVLCYRPKHWRRTLGGRKFLLLSMAVIATAASFIGIWATLAGSWIPTLIPDEDWLVIVAAVILVSLALGWVGSEVLRVNALLGEQRRANRQEVTLRGQLQESYTQQQVMLEEVGRLYREQAQAAVTDPMHESYHLPFCRTSLFLFHGFLLLCDVIVISQSLL
jgi:hypothetical protein